MERPCCAKDQKPETWGNPKKQARILSAEKQTLGKGARKSDAVQDFEQTNGATLDQMLFST
jgi:hypothetical protein